MQSIILLVMLACGVGAGVWPAWVAYLGLVGVVSIHGDPEHGLGDFARAAGLLIGFHAIAAYGEYHHLLPWHTG